MKLLHVALSTLGYGETLIGLSLADQLRPLGVDSEFVISPISERVLKRSGHRAEVIDAPMGPLARLLIDDIVEKARPDAIVLSDYFTYCGVLERHFRLDPWFIDDYGLPILPIDIWEWEHTDLAIDMAGNYEHRVSKRILDLDVHLRPVPLAHLDDDASGRGFLFRLWDGEERVTRRTRGHLFTTLGLQPTDKLVLLPIAAWQQLPPESTRDDVARSSRAIPELLVSYLRQLPESAHFLLVGGSPPAFAGLPAERCHVMPPCSPKQYSTLLGSADLVVTLNVGATTLARAVLSDIPAMVLTNRFTVAGPRDVERVGAEIGGLTPAVRDWLAGALPLWPFRMWPLGFYSFLGPLLADNPYTETFARAELLDERGVVEGMVAALYDRPTRERYAAARAAYTRAVDGRVDTAASFLAAARQSGLAVEGIG